MASQPAARLTIPGICHNLPIRALPDGAAGYEVTWLNGQAQIVLPIGLTENGQEVRLTISARHLLDQITYAAMLDQARYADATVPPGRAA
jgi:hypothetical protein